MGWPPNLCKCGLNKLKSDNKFILCGILCPINFSRFYNEQNLTCSLPFRIFIELPLTLLVADYQLPFTMAGYSETPLVKKLGIKPNAKMKVMHAPDGYWDWVSPLPEGISTSAKAAFDFVHLFVTSKKKFEAEVLKLRDKLQPDGMIWVSWPKKASKVETDLDENIIRHFALKNKLVDVKVCAVSDVWSGLKLVIPVALR